MIRSRNHSTQLHAIIAMSFDQNVPHVCLHLRKPSKWISKRSLKFDDLWEIHLVYAVESTIFGGWQIYFERWKTLRLNIWKMLLSTLGVEQLTLLWTECSKWTVKETISKLKMNSKIWSPNCHISRGDRNQPIRKDSRSFNKGLKI